MLSAFTVTAMQVGKHWRCPSNRLAALVCTTSIVVACQFPSTSNKYVCDIDDDCDPDRVCSPTKYCVLPSAMEMDAGTGSDAGPIDGTPIDADPFAATRAACIAAGYTLEASTNGYYKKVTAADDFNAASADCNDDVPGATHLITLSTDAEVTFSRTLNNSWLGWVDRPVENMWHVLTAEVPAINIETYWGGGNRPDGGNSENCAVIRVSNPNGIDDVDCPQNHPYICECDGMPVLP
jgi:hypothetical protein